VGRAKIAADAVDEVRQMKNPPFRYLRPDSLDEALALLAEHGGDAKVLAGGQSLLPLMALRLAAPGIVIDIGRVPGLDRIDVDADGAVTIGALVTHTAAERSAELGEHAPLVHEAMPYIGHRAIRNRGTVCGSVAHGDPAAEMPAVMLATSAMVGASSAAGEREIAAADFFAGYLDTTLRDDELVVAVRFPPWAAGGVGSIVEVARRHGDFALVGLVTRLEVVGGTITDAALSFLGVAGTPYRVGDAERAVVGGPPSEDAFEAAAEIVRATVQPSGDLHATAAYRRHVAGVLTRRGLAAATSRIGAPA
jgi:aerobic carbon-monoxide dehydrogenase medium subunit